MQRAPSPHGSGRSTAPGFCGPIRSAPGCSAPPMALSSPRGFSVRRMRSGARRRNSQGGCRRPARSGWGGWAASGRRPPTSLPARAVPLAERLHRLVEGIDTPIAAFTRDGMFVGASDAARSLLGFRNLSEAGLDDARSDALKQGRAETPIGIGHMVLQRVGTAADVGLVALIAPDTTQAAPRHLVPALAEASVADRPMPDYERPGISGEAPAEFALIDEFVESPAEAAVQHLVPDQPPGPDLRTVLQPDVPCVEASCAGTSAQAQTSAM